MGGIEHFRFEQCEIRGQTNRGYKNTNPDTDIHLLIFVSYKWNRILEKGIRIGENRIKNFQY